MIFNFSQLSETQNIILNWLFVISILVGFSIGLTGKTFKWEKKIKPYLFYLGMILIIGNLIWSFVIKK